MRNILNFITNNSGLIMTLLMAIVGLVGAIISKNKQKVYANIYALASEAQLLESATGADKFNYVLDNAYKSLPLFIKIFISEDNIKMGIEYSLTKLKAFAAAQMETTNMSALLTTVQVNNTTEEIKQVTIEKTISDDTIIATDEIALDSKIQVTTAPILSPQDAINQINEIVKNITVTQSVAQ